jgi:hypothetical protein
MKSTLIQYQKSEKKMSTCCGKGGGTPTYPKNITRKRRRKRIKQPLTYTNRRVKRIVDWALDEGNVPEGASFGELLWWHYKLRWTWGYWDR